MGIKISNIIFLCVLGTILLSSSAFAATYTSVKNIPAVCTGGTVTENSFAGTCRTLTCTGSSGSVQVLACDKPDSGVKQYFEMYKKTSSGTVPKLCIDTACIQGNGYAKSTNFPIVQNEPSTNTTNPPSTNTSTNQQCTSTVRELQATCTGGTISSDTSTFSCRTIKCDGSSGTLTILACNKPDSGTKQYFEMYRQSGSGTMPKICLGSTCLQNAGYIKSPNYPICNSGESTTNTTNPPSNNTNSTNTSTTTDPVGLASFLMLDNANINGKGLYDNRPYEIRRNITVTQGQDIKGTVTLEYNNSWQSGVRVVLGVTPSWGDNAQSFVDLGVLNPGLNYITVPIDFTAPTTSGRHHIIFAFRAETTTAHVFSMTNWAAGSPVWNDGNDIADWSASQISEANNNGRVVAPVKVQNGMRNYYVPSTTIEIDVVSKDQLSDSSISLIVNGQQRTLSSNMPESERTFNIPVRDWSLAGVFYQAADHYTTYSTGMKDEVYREDGTGGRIVSDTFCDGSYMNVELLGSQDVSSSNPAKIHILRTQPGHEDLDVILNFVPTNSNIVTGTVSPSLDWNSLGEAFIHQYVRDRNDMYLQHYFIEGSSQAAFNKDIFLQRVNQSLAEGKTQITLSSERIKHPTDATAKNKYTFTFRNPSASASTTWVIESEYLDDFNFEDHNLWQSSRYDIYLLRKAGIPVNEFSTIDSHWRSANCANVENR